MRDQNLEKLVFYILWLLLDGRLLVAPTKNVCREQMYYLKKVIVIQCGQKISVEKKNAMAQLLKGVILTQIVLFNKQFPGTNVSRF